MKSSNPAAERRKEQERLRQRQRKLLIGITAAAVLVVVLLVVLFLQPKSDNADQANNTNKSDSTGASNSVFNYDQLPVMGKADAPVKIVEFGDFQCPVCRDFNQQIKPLLQPYIDEGKVAFYFADFIVIDKAEGDSNRAALAAHSVHHQNQEEYWKFHDALYRDQGEEMSGWVTTDFLVNLAKSEKINVDYDKLRSDIEKGTYQNEVDEQNQVADKLHVPGTPTMFINGKEYKGEYDHNSLKKAIDEAGQGK